MQIAPHIHRLGNSSIVNSYLVEESGEVTIIDAGCPASTGISPASWRRWVGPSPMCARSC
jgi:hypothetical protein